MNRIIQFFLTHRRWLISYGLVGALSALVYFSFFSLFWKWAALDYRIAVSIGYILSVLTHFFLNRRFTFGHKGNENLLRHVLCYSVMLSMNYILTLGIVSVVVSGLGYSPYLGIVVSIAFTVGTGYLMAKFWVFKQSLIK